MSSVFLSNVNGLAPFDCSETAGISARWERWLRAFELFAAGKGGSEGGFIPTHCKTVCWNVSSHLNPRPVPGLKDGFLECNPTNFQ